MDEKLYTTLDRAVASYLSGKSDVSSLQEILTINGIKPCIKEEYIDNIFVKINKVELKRIDVIYLKLGELDGNIIYVIATVLSAGDEKFVVEIKINELLGECG